MFVLITQAQVYTPEYAGALDVLIGGGKILTIQDKLKVSDLSSWEVHHIDGSNMRLVPGGIDPHVHIAGAGGEGGPATRTAEMPLRDLLEGGITSVVGCLGTDGITRDVESVLMKAKSLREEGISAWIYTGAYQVPPPTITGTPARDLALIEEVIGVGEIALSDHRSSFPTMQELIRLTSDARVAAMLAGKAGVINIHMGDAPQPFEPILQVVNNSVLPLKQFYPTHCNRNKEIYTASKKYGKEGYVDLTSSSYPYFQDVEVRPSKAVRGLMEAGVPLQHITLSSDANGSLPAFDALGNLVRLEKGKPSANLHELKDMVEQEKIPMETAIQTVSTNAAKILKLKGKGMIQSGFDADLILLDAHYNIRYLIARGQIMVDDYKTIRKGHYDA